MFCSNCGMQIANGVKFCSGCGAHVGDADIPHATPTATLTISRHTKMMEESIPYTVLLDDEYLTDIRRGDKKSFDIPQGQHIIQAVYNGYKMVDSSGMEQINVGDAGVDIVLEQKMGRFMHNKIVMQINYPATRPAANNIQNGDDGTGADAELLTALEKAYTQIQATGEIPRCPSGFSARLLTPPEEMACYFQGDDYKAIKEQYFGIGGLGYVEPQFQRRRVTARISYSVYLDMGVIFPKNTDWIEQLTSMEYQDAVNALGILGF